MTDVEPQPARWYYRIAGAARRAAPLALAMTLVGTALGGLLIGYEPVGGDPDRLYRPLKSELSRSLAARELPFWSNRFGLGVPLVAESHVAAFYPPNLVLYGLFDVSTAYRLSMWLHYVALVATTYAYGRCLKFSPWGSGLAGIAFSLCGFQAIHSSHEPFYSLMPYLPLALALAESYMASGRLAWLALLALVLGIQWTLGHFQIQAWTNVLVIFTGLWRWTVDRGSWRRALLLVPATVWGTGLAAVQLGPSWQYSDLVGQTRRAPSELLYYHFPPVNWFDLVLPQLIRDLRNGPDDHYWFSHQTEAYEVALHIGTIPLILVFLAVVSRPASRATLPWKFVIPISLALATMMVWWPEGYLGLVRLAPFSYFRVPARYTLLSSFGLAVLAGEGFDHTISRVRFRAGLASAILFATLAAAAAVLWTNRPEVHLRPLLGRIPGGFLWGALVWSCLPAAVVGWRKRWLRPWTLLVLAAAELGILFYHGTTEWGAAIELPGRSGVLAELARRSPQGLIGGDLGNLPVRLGLKTARPYLGFAQLPLNRLLLRLQDRPLRGGELAIDEHTRGLTFVQIKRWLRRWRVSVLVGSHPTIRELGKNVGDWADPTLDRVVARDPFQPAPRDWSIVLLADPIPEVRAAVRAYTAATLGDLLNRFTREDDLDVAWFLSEDDVPGRPAAESARVVSWDGDRGTVEHEGTCDLVIARSFDPGWKARINDGPPQQVLHVDGGYQGVRITGTGVHRVVLEYRPPGWVWYVRLSSLSAAVVLLVLLVSLGASAWHRTRTPGAKSVTG
jgi:Bacterial membrane protein YfhO